MPRARVRDADPLVELEYDLHGQGQPLLLIMGIGSQLILWHQRLVECFVQRGFQVVRFDNRDVGKSTWLRDAPVPSPSQIISRGYLKLPVSAPYSLSDMASDTVGLLNHLGWQHAHIVGVSMGGMIAQHLAIEHPDRVASLTSIMSTTGGRLVSLPQPRALKALMAPAPTTLHEAEDSLVRFFTAVAGPAYPQDEAELRALARQSWSRGSNPAAFARQFAAVIKSGDRTRRLHDVTAPTLVLHGTADPLVPLRAGRATAKAIPHSRLREIIGLGHGLPEGVWPVLVDEISELALAHPVAVD
ncbi:MAG: alpha/beta fold hydrolase [Oligoflexia bacterium]|nr:alpha/beta fold hydrolase [Oligoflexia bacterium]